PQSISTYFYKFQSISIILSPYHSYLLIPFLTLLIYSLNGYQIPVSPSLYLKSIAQGGSNISCCRSFSGRAVL
ncbi:MAG: hypothetical protein AB1422_12640, partial [bacterium]